MESGLFPLRKSKVVTALAGRERCFIVVNRNNGQSSPKFPLNTSLNFYENPRWFFVEASATDDNPVFFSDLLVGMPAPLGWSGSVISQSHTGTANLSVNGYGQIMELKTLPNWTWWWKFFSYFHLGTSPNYRVHRLKDITDWETSPNGGHLETSEKIDSRWAAQVVSVSSPPAVLLFSRLSSVLIHV